MYIQEFPRSQKAQWAKCPEPNEPGRLVGMIGRKQVASYPLQVARVSGLVGLRIKIIADVKAASHRLRYRAARLSSWNAGPDESLLKRRLPVIHNQRHGTGNQEARPESR